MATAVRRTGGHVLKQKYGEDYFVKLGRKSWDKRPRKKKK